MRNNGGAAFPALNHTSHGVLVKAQRGMSLRDYFAAAAMQGNVASPNIANAAADVIAKSAYMLADAMIAERAKEKS